MDEYEAYWYGPVICENASDIKITVFGTDHFISNYRMYIGELNTEVDFNYNNLWTEHTYADAYREFLFGE